MQLVTHIRKITDQLMYNQLYAPGYPAEDLTNVDREERLINEWLVQAITATAKREDMGDWLRLGQGSVTAAFEKFRKGDGRHARKDIEAAIEYLRNAASKKPHKVDFVAKFDGSIERAPE
jgi:hypothetical protein